MALAYQSPELSFEELASLSNDSLPQRISIRGFAYRTPDQEWVLSHQPGLRSCCIGRGGSREITLEGFKEEIAMGQAIQVQGVLRLESREGLGEPLRQLVLSEVVVSPSTTDFSYAIWGTLLAAAVGGWLWIRTRKGH